MVLVAVRVLDLQLALKERLPLLRQLSLYEMRHGEHLSFGRALEMNVRHLLIVCVFLVIDLEYERVAWLLQPLHELKVHQVEAQRVRADDHFVLLLSFVNTLLLDIIVTRFTADFLVDYKDILLKLGLSRDTK